MVTTITDVLNTWANMGVFSYVIPFLLIFAVVFGVLQKTRLFAQITSGSKETAKYQHNRAIEAIIAAAVGLLALQFDFVSEFYAVIFPRFGIGLSIFLVLLILIAFFHEPKGDTDNKYITWIGWLTGIGVVIWALSSWDQWGYYSGFGGWFSDYIWALIVLGAIIAIIIVVASSSNDTPAPTGG